MTPEEAIREVTRGTLRPVYLVVGEERVLMDGVVRAVRKAALQGAVAGFNEEKLTAGEADVERVLNSARTAPMMAPRRLVIVRELERWDTRGPESEASGSRGEGDKPAKGKSSADKGAGALDRLAEFAINSVPSTCLLLTASKLDGRRKLVALAKKQGFWIGCEPVSRRELPGYIERAAKQRGHALEPGVAELLAEIAGPELGAVHDAIERLSLYVGEGSAITGDDVAACVTRVRLSTVWELVAAVSRRDSATSLRVLADVYDPADRGLRLVGVLAWSVRQLLRFASARQGGASLEEAAARAKVPPFRAKELAAQASRVKLLDLERWLGGLAEADLALKGSRRPPRAVLESAILTMTIGAPR